MTRRITAGKRLRRQMDAALPEGFEWTEKESALLDLASAQADQCQRLQHVLDDAGVMSTGSQGQPVLHPAVAELRQGQAALAALLRQVRLPDEVDLRQQRNAKARWAEERRKHGKAS